MDNDPRNTALPTPPRLSHELRNLLASIDLQAQTLEMLFETNGSDRERETVKGIRDAVKKMEALIARELESPNS